MPCNFAWSYAESVQIDCSKFDSGTQSKIMKEFDAEKQNIRHIFIFTY